jgi:hypothetical protein
MSEKDTVLVLAAAYDDVDAAEADSRGHGPGEPVYACYGSLTTPGCTVPLLQRLPEQTTAPAGGHGLWPRME